MNFRKTTLRLGLSVLCAAWVTCRISAQIPSSVSGHAVESARDWVSLASSHDRAVLLFFVASDCPISNRYFPEMERIAREYAGRGVRTWYVYPNAGETRDGIQKHQAEFHAPSPAARPDGNGSLARLTSVRTTPEAALLVRAVDGSLRTVYAGRIDDRYVNIGLERPQAEHHDLEDAIAATLANKPVPRPGGPPVGCSIMPGEAAKGRPYR